MFCCSNVFYISLDHFEINGSRLIPFFSRGQVIETELLSRLRGSGFEILLSIRTQFLNLASTLFLFFLFFLQIVDVSVSAQSVNPIPPSILAPTKFDPRRIKEFRAFVSTLGSKSNSNSGRLESKGVEGG